MSPASCRSSFADAAIQRSNSNAVDRLLTAAEFGRLIVKLRWIGADSDANALAEYLANVAPRGFAIVPSGDTD